MTDNGPRRDDDRALQWLIEHEEQLAVYNRRWVALSNGGPLGAAEDLGQLVDEFGLEEPLYHFVAFAEDDDGRPIVPRRP